MLITKANSSFSEVRVVPTIEKPEVVKMAFETDSFETTLPLFE
ncbi:MAG: hypothetical protein RLP12_06880 [Ekhidna sp.]